MKAPVAIRRLAAAYTLVELSMALIVGLTIASVVLVLFNQQVSFLQIYKAQNFLLHEAPTINAYLQRMVGQADKFALYANKTNAVAGTGALSSNAPVLLLQFNEPNGTVKSTIISFETLNSIPQLNYYLVPTSGSLATPQWSITTRPTNVSFSVVNGILQINLTGPSGETITFSGDMQL